MNTKNKGYVVPVAIGVLVLASLGLLIYSWGNEAKKVNVPVGHIVSSSTPNSAVTQSAATDDATLDADSAVIDAQIKALDNGNADINNSLSDTSTI